MEGEDKYAFYSIFVDFDSFVSIFIYISIANIIPDYISLLETRYIISRLKKTKTLLGHIIWLLIDLVATFLIISIFLIVILVIEGMLSSDTLLDIYEEIFILALLIFMGLTEITGDGIGGEQNVVIWTTFFTSAWVLLFAFGQLLTRLAFPLASKIKFSQYVLPIDEFPFRSIGVVMAFSSCIIVWVFLVPLSLVL